MVRRELDVAVHTLNSSTRKAEAGESEFETCDKRLKRKKVSFYWVWREKDYRLRALVALPEDPGSIPSTHMVSHTCLRT